MNLASFFVNRLNQHSLRSKKYKETFLPIIRSNEGLNDDEEYIKSAIDQVKFLQKYCNITSSTKILDFGCGQGRLANGFILSGLYQVSYHGIDTNAKSISWCKHWLQKHHPNFDFLWLPAQNARYNPSANKLQELPMEQNFFDVIFLNSVFSHMLVDDIKFYLMEFSRVLSKHGILYLTAFIEDNVPKMEENPLGYLGQSSGALHRVRYEKQFFFSLLQDSDFDIINFHHHGIERTKQSVVIAKKDAQ